MTGSIDMSSLVNSLIYIVPLIGLMVTIYSQANLYRERREKSASAAAELKAEIRQLSKDVESLKNSYDEARDGYHRNAERLTKLEQQARSLEARVKEIEREVRNVN